MKLEVGKMKGKNAAFTWSVLHSIGDSLEEKVLLKFNEAQYLFWVHLMIGIVIVIFSIFGGVEMSIFSFLVLLFYTFAMIGGDFCYVRAIQTLPIGLANLIDSGSLFLILVCDICLGYIKPRLSFLILFLLFFVAIYVFSYETNKMKSEIKNKKIDLKNIFILITSTIFYASEPYFIKLASSKGANEFGINLVYYLVATIVLYFLYRKEKKNIPAISKSEKKEFYGSVVLLGIIYAITSILTMLAYASDAPVLITLIMKLQLFFVVLLSVIRKTDKMNVKKTISLFVGVVCILIMTFMS